MVAMIFMRPPQRQHAKTSAANTLRNKSAHAIRDEAGRRLLGSMTITVVPSLQGWRSAYFNRPAGISSNRSVASVIRSAIAISRNAASGDPGPIQFVGATRKDHVVTATPRGLRVRRSAVRRVAASSAWSSRWIPASRQGVPRALDRRAIG